MPTLQHDAMRELEGWRDGTGPYDVGNMMAMHSRFPNSGLGRGSGNLFPLAHLLFFAYCSFVHNQSI